LEIIAASWRLEKTKGVLSVYTSRCCANVKKYAPEILPTHYAGTSALACPAERSPVPAVYTKLHAEIYLIG
jgi:hypothetical protein